MRLCDLSYFFCLECVWAVEDTSNIKYRALEITTEIKQSLQIQSVLNSVAPAHIGKGVESVSEVGGNQYGRLR